MDNGVQSTNIIIKCMTSHHNKNAFACTFLILGYSANIYANTNATINNVVSDFSCSPPDSSCGTLPKMYNKITELGSFIQYQLRCYKQLKFDSGKL